jgi:hypothetical protein
MTGFDSKRKMAQAKLDDDADTLLIVYQRGFADGKRSAQRKQKGIIMKHAQSENQEPVADGNKVICPACCHQFRAIPTAVQTLMLNAGFEPPFVTPSAAQRPWVGLEIEEVQDSYNSDYQAQTRAVEAKLKERNT